ncbi:MAG: hypothetical protein LBV45_07285 [Xanthomonadaceae bacterium]|jgi:hypothetical protein|nr:hypothetical protein [Xanthomonadaceae bacterium]
MPATWEEGIDLQVIELLEVRKGFVLLLKLWVVEHRSGWLDYPHCRQSFNNSCAFVAMSDKGRYFDEAGYVRRELTAARPNGNFRFAMIDQAGTL